MRYIAASTVPVDDIVFQPVGTVVYAELDPDAPASRAQSYLSGRARTADADISTEVYFLLHPATRTTTQVIRVEVLREATKPRVQRVHPES